MAKKALITGITGQDGSYLAEFLLGKGYDVQGLYRRSSIDIFERTEHIRGLIKLVEGDMTDSASLNNALAKVQPDEVYNLAAQSFVPASWSQPIATAEMTGMGVLKMLESIKSVDPKIKMYQASSSEMFGKVQETPQKETTKFYPRSPYGVSKLFGHWMAVNFRESYGLFVCNGILFNHESPRRGKQFVTRKISHSVAKIKLGLQDHFELGNMDAKRDWGYAGDYVEAMWMMLQQEKPDDYVVASGETHSVRDFVKAAFNCVDMDVKFEGQGIDEVGRVNGKEVVRVNEKFYRPAEVDILLGDPTKAKQILGWEPKVKFDGLVEMMVKSDLDSLSKK